jgi:hypothetical protein
MPKNARPPLLVLVILAFSRIAAAVVANRSLLVLCDRHDETDSSVEQCRALACTQPITHACSQRFLVFDVRQVALPRRGMVQVP